MNEFPAGTLPEPRPVEWPPPSSAEVLKRARTAADEILAGAEAEAAKLRTESAALRAEVETAVNEAERRRRQAADERGRVTALLEEEVAAGREAVRLSQERAAKLTADADDLLAHARGEAATLLGEAREASRALDAEKARLAAGWKEVRESAAGIAAEAVARGKAEAEQYLAAARKEAAGVTADAQKKADRLIREAQDAAERAQAETDRLREQAATRSSLKAANNRLIDEWSPRVALSATILLTASGELSLAVLTGWPPVIAWGLPLAIDVYVVQALRRHRDVVLALLLMVAANATYHLAEAGLFGVQTDSHGHLKPEWWLIAGVAAIAPWVMLRLHHITGPKQSRKSRWRRRGESSGESACAADESRIEVLRESSHEASRESDRESSHGGAGESDSALSRRRALPPGESSHESAVAGSHESASRSRAKRAGKPQRRCESGRRESASKVASLGDIEAEVDALTALMRERGDAGAVTLTDAKKITGGSDATAARRLSAARGKYRETPAITQLTKEL
ncbi:hypothetical protein [Streptomyces abikoensis]|uniref:Large Ala/Glu-rich protein n=1 Tax=Streptomyces abikoensis TaxID=97398 RepID=A0ABW7TE24_9ACTN